MGFGEMQRSPMAKSITVPFLRIKMMGVHTLQGCLRVGKVRPGNSPPTNTAINSGIEPPRLTHAMREAKMKFIKATMRLLVIDEAKQEDVFAVERWVLMPQNTFTVSTSGTKRKYGEKGQNKTLTTTQPSTPSVKTSTQNFTMITPTSDMIPSLDERHCLSQEFPVLTSFNPSLLQRGSRVVNGVDLDCQLFNGMIDESVRLCARWDVRAHHIVGALLGIHWGMIDRV